MSAPEQTLDEITPLVEVERAVQARAKDIALDMGTPTGRSGLKELIREELTRWDDDVRRGRRTFPLTNPDIVAERAWRNLAEYGPLTELLADPAVWEIEINAPGEVFVKRHGRASGYHHEAFHDDDHVVRTLTKLLDDSSASHRKLDASEGLQDAQLDDGSRLHIVHGDLSRGGHLMVNIRRFTGVPFTRLDELVDRDTISPSAARFLAAAVRTGATIVFAGAPGSGKTTLLSCCVGELDPSLRVVIAEEVFEIDAPLPNVASMQTRPARPDRPGVDLRRLVAGFLRMAPDVAIVGEVRDREALPLLLTLSSGVKGFTTIHAANARGALSRVRFLAELSESASNLPHSALTTLVADAVDIVVFSQRTPAGPQVTEVLAVEDLAGSPESGAFTVTDLYSRCGPDRALSWAGNVPVRLGERFASAGEDLLALLHDGEVAS
ncbi:MAG TPA: ATPase, T2SS/T4P/T4SS family [Acidimicrobiales bacterium]